MKFKCKKTGFTLAEMLVVLLIITVLTVFSINAIRPKAATTPLLYYKAWEALDTAANAAYSYTGTKIGAVFAPDVATLCDQLAGPVNGYINTAELNCARGGLAIPTPGNEGFTRGNAHFIATNGMRFFISQDLKTTYQLGTVYQGADNRPVNWEWYIIFVDLDGEKGLGSMAQPSDSNSTADVVAFAFVLTPPNRLPAVVPIGAPAMDQRYMTAVVRYANTNSEYARISPSLSYKDAAIRAYGSQQKGGSSIKVRRPERIYFEDYIGSGNKLFHVPLPTGITLDNGSRTQAPVNINAPGCKEDSESNPCSVIINSYTGTSSR